MKKFLFIMLLNLLITGIGTCQNSSYLQLLDSAKAKAGFFLTARPLSVRLEFLRPSHLQYIKQQSGYDLNDTLFKALRDKTTTMDTTVWKREDFERIIVIENREANISAKEYLSFWGINEPEEKKRIRKKINKWVNTDPMNRASAGLSKPLMTDDGQWGIFSYHTVKGNLCCGGKTDLYRYQENKWIFVATIQSWAY